jgi:hypothetical protein
MYSRLMTSGLTLSMAATGLLLAGPAQAASGTLTNFSADAVSYGSKTTGDPNTQSGATAAAFFPCTRYVPRDTHNFAGTVSRGGTQLNGVNSDNFSENGPVSITSRNTIDNGTLADGVVAFTNLRARARVYHNASGFQETTVSSLGSLSLTTLGTTTPVPLTGDPQTVPVPGVGTLYVNYTSSQDGVHHASAAVNVLRLEQDNGTTVKVGRATSQLNDGVTQGVFSGAAWGSQSETGSTVTTGRTALKPIACPGTGGKPITTQTGATDLDLGFAGAQTSTVYGAQGRTDADGYTHSQIDRARFGGDVLAFRNINAWARVTRNADGSYVESSKGTGVGEILINGQTVQAPKPGVSRKVAGLGTFTVGVVDKSRTGLEVIGVEVRLFNGAATDTIVRLANAKLNIRRG